MVTINSLIEKIYSYNSKADVETIKKAYIFSREAHCSQRRVEGSPYIHHPLAVADILADMRLDTPTVAAGLLHDTVEDTGIYAEDIREMFGNEISFLVEALTKLSRVEFKTKEDAQAENFRKMLLAMSKDARVILIKFADRLHNMKTLEYLSEDKKIRIASETLDIYAPLANRLGIGWLRTELEDLCFMTLMPDLFSDLQKKVTQRREGQKEYIDEVKNIVSEKLAAAGIPVRIKGRLKHYYGIYQKMTKQKIPFEQIHDVIGLRLMTDTVGHCYDILGIIHSLWPLVPGRFKDFISLPKSNYYQSLHTTVIGPGGDRVEFQIRTEDMNEIAEEGIAAHWRYKQSDSLDAKNAKFVAWLRELVKESSDAKEFLEAVKGQVVPDTAYVFTPKGDIKELPVGSSPVDFAYDIHTQVGHKCVGAKVNGRIVPLKYKLNNGDVVEIITAPSHGPSKDWLKFVVTQRAKNRIKQWIKTEERAKSIELGNKLIEDELKRHGIPFSTLKSEKMNEVLKSFSFQTLDDLYVGVGYAKVSVHQVVHKLVPEKTEAEKTDEAQFHKHHKPAVSKDNVIKITGIDNVLYYLGKCCYPVAGDKIAGFITKGKGVTIHRRDCKNLERLASGSEKLIDVEWSKDSDILSSSKIFIECADKPGLMAALSSLISSANINISSIKANSTNDKRAFMELVLQVKDKDQLNTVINKISQIDGVLGVRR